MDRAFLERRPKVELHVHLEGAIPLQAEIDAFFAAEQAFPGRA